MTMMRVVGECFFWYRLTRVFPDKFHRAVKRLCVCCVWLPQRTATLDKIRSISILRKTTQRWNIVIRIFLYCLPLLTIYCLKFTSAFYPQLSMPLITEPCYYPSIWSMGGVSCVFCSVTVFSIGTSPIGVKFGTRHYQYPKRNCGPKHTHQVDFRGAIWRDMSFANTLVLIISTG